MAELPSLVIALARMGGYPCAALDMIARSIRAEGLLTDGKCGEGAAQMSVRDAANFLIGANAVYSPDPAVAAVKQFRNFERAHPKGYGAGGRDAATFALLAACGTLGDAIEVLIAEAANLRDMFRCWTRQSFGKGIDPFADTDEASHRFRPKPATCSDSSQPGIPTEASRGGGMV
jgi:hypothetical protein